MNGGLREIILFLINRRYIGNKHFPECKLIKSRTKYLSKEENKEFEKQYRQLINNLFLIKLKKRTGKGTEWHISLNPRKLGELYGIIK